MPGTTSAAPIREATRMGAAENDSSASIAKPIIFSRVYFDSPARRGGAEKGTNARGNPTHDTMPRRNRWRSGIEMRAACARAESRQKSAAPGTISVSLRRLISQ